MTQECPVCSHCSEHFVQRDGYEFYDCKGCGMIFIDKSVLERIDSGNPIMEYQDNYWEMEMPAAIQRCKGAGIARLAEVIYYCRKPVERFIDIGTGTGYILDAIASYLPKNADRFFGVEVFPPPNEYRTQLPNYVVGSVADAPGVFEAGMCIEVIEHFTPRMVSNLIQELATVSTEGSLFLFNTGLASYVREGEIAYVDPKVRGHICFWTTEAINILVNPHGFRAIDLPGRHWAFLIERGSMNDAVVDVTFRVQNPLPQNRRLLADGDGDDSVLVQLAHEAGYHYLCEDMVATRTRWAQSLLKE